MVDTFEPIIFSHIIDKGSSWNSSLIKFMLDMSPDLMCKAIDIIRRLGSTARRHAALVVMLIYVSVASICYFSSRNADLGDAKKKSKLERDMLI
jgi:hypothetical protein